MKLSLFDDSHTDAVIDLLRQAFTDSEGKEEGEMIATLVAELIESTEPSSLVGFMASNHDDELLGAIFFSRFTVSDQSSAFILSPVGVSTDVQGSSVGQSLITFGLDYLKMQDVEFVLTYGDPNYYTRVGFQQITESLIPAPFPLSQPHGWMAQSLNSKPLSQKPGPTRCVTALSKPEYW